MRAVSCVLLLAAAAAACSPTSSSDSAPASDRDGAAPEAGEEVSTAVPGSSLAAVRVGMSYREVRALLGEGTLGVWVPPATEAT